MPWPHAVSHDSHIEPRYVLVFGLLALFLAVAGSLTGEALTKGKMVYREEEPRQFWTLIALWYVGGVCFIGYFLYKTYGFSR